MRTSGLSWTAALLGLVCASGVAAPPGAHAAMRADTFLLGRSAKSGAVCEAVRDDTDPMVDRRGARAWEVRCRGWSVPLGRIYAFEQDGAKVLAPKGPYDAVLDKRTTCTGASTQTLKGLGEVRVQACKLGAGGVDWVVYRGRRGGVAAAVEGFPQVSDILETGLKIAAGAAQPARSATARQSSDTAQSAGDQSGALEAALKAVAMAPENLRTRAYTKNLEWNFDGAQTDFQALAQDEHLPARSRAEAYLNWALNVSNTGRFDQAEPLFDRAQALAAAAGDPGLESMALSYRALHLRNQRRFRDSADAAGQARAKLEALVARSDADVGVQTLKQEGGVLVVTPEAAAALNRRTSEASLLNGSRVDPRARLRVQLAQALLTEATARGELGETAVAQQRLQQAAALLQDPAAIDIATWLSAQVQAELARGQGAARPAEARARLEQALLNVQKRQTGSAAEAYLLVELARAEAASGETQAALKHFSDGFTLFRATRGSLGASAGASSAYFDLLLDQIRKDPAHRADYEARFFSAASSVTSQGVADTVKKLSARLSESGGQAAGLSRALEDTTRQLQIAEAAVTSMAPDAAPAVRKAAQDRVRTLGEQKDEIQRQLVAANPRYGELIQGDELKLKDLQAKLRPGELYLKVVLVDRRGYGMAMSKDAAEPYAIALTQDEATARIRALRAPFETAGRLPRYDVAAAASLFDALFGPVRAQVLAADNLIYEPDSAILSLPLAALVTDKASVELIEQRRAAIRAAGAGVLSYDGVTFVGAKARTSLTVSAGSFVQSRDFAPSKAGRAFLGFGAAVPPSAADPKAFASVLDRGAHADADASVCDATRGALLSLPILPDAGAELDEVAQTMHAGPGDTVQGMAFTEQGVRDRKDIGQYRVLYFATHGLLPKPGGCLSEPALVTSVGAGDSGDGLLNSSDILDLKLDADLVVLSACDTGGGGGGAKGGLSGGGEALSGLTRAFIYAGARGLVVSHWQVDSRATRRLMTAMFKAGGIAQSEALREAELAMMKSPDQYSHPYYWAAFTLVGDGERAMPRLPN